VIEHDHGLTARDDRIIRNNWERVERTADRIIDMMRESREQACAPWCVPQAFESMLLMFSRFEQVALLHVMTARLLDREDLDRGLDAPTPPC
jgi:hypothetical protein